MLYTVEQLRQIERAALASSGPTTLMQFAAEAAAERALKLLTQPEQSVLVLVGPGNNGGDALLTAILIAKAGHNVFVLHHPPKATMSPEYQSALNQAQACSQLNWLDSDISLEKSYSLVVDGLFGVGMISRAMPAVIARQIEEVNALHHYHSQKFPVLALDVPSGLDPDTGNLLAPVAIRASHTITFIGDKPGLHTAYGRDFAGIVEVADLGIPPHLRPISSMRLNKPELFANLLQTRRQNTNKGDFGAALIIGGAIGMQGAVVLAARAALYSGAGKVLAGFVESPPTFDPIQPELMCRVADQSLIQDATSVVIGPGLGATTARIDLLRDALIHAKILIMDADALNLMAQHPDLIALCLKRNELSTLLTPHPLEASRLLQCSADDIQTNRIEASKKLAAHYNAIIILKGSGSILAHPRDKIVVNPTGNAALASGGTGDVLAGVCGSLAAQHNDLWQAALAATWLHGAAADELVASGNGPVGLSAGELVKAIRKVLNLHLM